MKLTKIRNIAVILALVILSGSIGYDIGRRKIAFTWSQHKPYVTIANQQPPPSKDIDFSLFWTVWDRLEKSYIDRGELVAQNMVWGAIKGMVASLGDPYTVFLPPEENKRSKEDLAGSFEGIGAQLGMKNKRIVVVAPLKGMPAEKAGLKAGDYIIEVDGKDTSGWTLPEAVNNIRGPKGTKVVLTIVREGGNGTKKIEILRGTIKVPSLEVVLASAKCSKLDQSSRQAKEARETDTETEGKTCKVVEDECAACAPVAVLRLYRFGDRTNGEWVDAVEQIVKYKEKIEKQGEKFKGLIFDLRNNPGGYLQSSVYVASEFLESGVVVRQQMTDGTSEIFKVNRKGALTKIPLVVLVNNGSASASEIVAGALKDHKRAKVIGTVTFGKGSVQEAQELPQGAGLHVTIAKWLLPNGKSISKNGIEPDIIVENNAKDATRDLQMERAIAELVK